MHTALKGIGVSGKTTQFQQNFDSTGKEKHIPGKHKVVSP